MKTETSLGDGRIYSTQDRDGMRTGRQNNDGPREGKDGTERRKTNKDEAMLIRGRVNQKHKDRRRGDNGGRKGSHQKEEQGYIITRQGLYNGKGGENKVKTWV